LPQNVFPIHSVTNMLGNIMRTSNYQLTSKGFQLQYLQFPPMYGLLPQVISVCWASGSREVAV